MSILLVSMKIKCIFLDLFAGVLEAWSKPRSTILNLRELENKKQ